MISCKLVKKLAILQQCLYEGNEIYADGENTILTNIHRRYTTSVATIFQYNHNHIYTKNLHGLEFWYPQFCLLNMPFTSSLSQL